MPPFGTRFRREVGSGKTLRAASDSIVGKAICRTVVALVGLDSHSLGLLLLSLSRTALG